MIGTGWRFSPASTSADAPRARVVGAASAAILLKSDGYPSYHLASVVDDAGMRISHVIRGEEWLPSAPKHVLLYHAFDAIQIIRGGPRRHAPRWAHLPLLMNAGGGKLSKRHKHGSVAALRASGYQGQALINFVARLGFTFSEDLLPLPKLAG